MKRIFLPSLFAAVVVFIWMAISWTVLPWHGNLLKSIPEGAGIETLKHNLTEKGIYHYPGMPAENTDAAMDEYTAKYQTGPVVHFMVYNPSGVDPMNPMTFIWSFLFNFLSVLIAAFILVKAINYKTTFMQRVLIVMLFGLFAALNGPLMDWNWWHYPFNFSIGVAVDLVITWFLAGLILAWRIHPEPAPLV